VGIQITDVTLRDGHQSLIATRMRTRDMLPIAEQLDKVGFFSLEVWGGATYDSCIRFLNEVVNFSQSNATTWTTWVVNRAYNTNYSTSSTSISNRLISYTDWTHQ